MMKIKLFLLFFLAAVLAKTERAIAIPGPEKPNFDRKEYYRVLKTGGLSEIAAEETIVAELGGNDGKAYNGGLLMRKAGLLRRPKDRLEAFKKGRFQLETAIRADPDRVEYHFLRLIIQEHAPNVVKYRDQLNEDRDLVRRQFSGLPSDLQEVIRDYSQGSAVLHPVEQ